MICFGIVHSFYTIIVLVHGTRSLYVVKSPSKPPPYELSMIEVSYVPSDIQCALRCQVTEGCTGFKYDSEFRECKTNQAGTNGTRDKQMVFLKCMFAYQNIDIRF